MSVSLACVMSLTVSACSVIVADSVVIRVHIISALAVSACMITAVVADPVVVHVNTVPSPMTYAVFHAAVIADSIVVRIGMASSLSATACIVTGTAVVTRSVSMMSAMASCKYSCCRHCEQCRE